MCVKRNHLKTTGQFILDAKKAHGDRYDYSLVEYKGGKIKVPIICNDHGIFMQAPVKHTTQKRGCPNCAKNKQKTTEEFILAAKEIHGETYDYSLTNYINKTSKVKIICPAHGEFEIIAHNHLWQRSGCLKCAQGQKSKPEMLWLESLNIPTLEYQKRIKIDGKFYKLDGYDPKTNTIYELHGDFWHGNPRFYESNHINKSNKKRFGELYENTKKRESIFKNAGYNYIYMWESDFLSTLNRKNYKNVLESWNRECLRRLYYYKLWDFADGEDCYIDPVAFIKP